MSLSISEDLRDLLPQLPKVQDIDWLKRIQCADVPIAYLRGNRDAAAISLLTTDQSGALLDVFARELDTAVCADMRDLRLLTSLIRCVGWLGGEGEVYALQLQLRRHVSEALLIELCSCMMSVGGRPRMKALLDIAASKKMSEDVRFEANDSYQELLTNGVYDASRLPKSRVLGRRPGSRIRFGEPIIGKAALSSSPSKSLALRVVRKLMGESTKLERLLEACVN